jgi:Na+/H+ antiporter NhaD/arsenite permease-like protein
MVAPFVILLLAIAVLPLIPFVEHWWERNLHRFYVAVALSVLTLLYYLVLHEIPVVSHWPGHDIVSHNPQGLNFGVTWTVLANAILGEYVPFIILLFTLYTITGGIRIEGDLTARPLTNSLFLAAGGLLASFIGTTGAAMLLIRPLLETNAERRHVRHTVVFFIFVVCNCGGCLLPIGDPPLFLGYLQGVPFWWTLSLWPEWLFVNGMLVAIYYCWDRFFAYPKETPRDIVRDETRVRRLKFSGLWPNAFLLLGVILSVALLDPSKPLPGTDWHPWLYLREVAQLALVFLSLVLGSDLVRRANNFNYGAILEVAALFLGIFICMQAPLQILNVRGPSLGLSTPMHFFWASGSLSSVLDNAPTYVVFFETAKTLGATPRVAGVGAALLTAVSLGSVFMGSMTYIGNGPNFMVKAIAEKSGVRMPSFFGYMVYSCLVLLPLLFLTTWFFLR